MRQISIKPRSKRVLYNVTVGINPAKIEEWKRFMREDHLPKIFASDCFESFRLCRIIDEQTDSTTLAVQYVAHSLEHLKKYNTIYAPQLQKEHLEKFGNDAVAYRSVLDILEEGEWDPA
tara:strand:- start:2110 stop:2466 length:357 start_codon:yes stop_codon:yes gene_type:complete